MCKVLRVSKSGYYKYLKEPESIRSLKNKRLLVEIRRIHIEYKRVYGSPRAAEELKKRGYSCSENTIAKIMRENNIYAKTKKKIKPITTVVDKTKLHSPNLLNQNFEINEINKVWTSDITYIPTKEGWAYMAVVLDIFSRNPIGYYIDNNMKEDIIIKALENAIIYRNYVIGEGIIFHSDRGSQYTSENFRKLLKSKNFIQSMSAKGNCFDNAVTETFFHTLKTEFINHEVFDSIEQAKTEIFKYIELFYKTKRLHSYLNYSSPVDFERRFIERLN